MAKSDKFKVVTSNGILANAGPQPKGASKPEGLTREQAESDARMRNGRAEKQDLEVRYDVVPLGD